MGCVVIVLSAMLLLAGEPGHALKTKELWLITPQEAALAPAPDGTGKDEVAVGGEADLGPAIEVIKPTNGGRSHPPVEVDIKFVPKTSPVDISTVKVTLKKLFNIDLTDRVQPYVTANGIHIPGAQLPSGVHTVRISIADKDGLRSFKDVTFEVVG